MTNRRQRGTFICHPRCNIATIMSLINSECLHSQYTHMLKILLMVNHYCIHTVLSNSGKTEDGDHSQPAEGSDAKTTLCTLSAQRRGSGKGNYCRGHCDRGPLCQSHAEKHTKKRSCHDHQIHRVFELNPDENSQCLYQLAGRT